MCNNYGLCTTLRPMNFFNSDIFNPVFFYTSLYIYLEVLTKNRGNSFVLQLSNLILKIILQRLSNKYVETQAEN